MMDSEYQNVLRALAQRGDVFFCQIGACDGKQFDQLYEFVCRFNWRGVLVEPVPDVFELLRSNYQHCSQLRFENVAISERFEQKVINRIPLDVIKANAVPEWAIGMSTFFPERNGIEDPHNEYPPGYALIRKFVRQELVTCVPLDYVFRKHDIAKLDLMQIDAEGCDYQILKQVDFNRFSPSVIFYESCHLPVDDRSAAIALLEKNGYSCTVLYANTLAIRS
jgi:FkbM family methyltransferase